MAHGNISDIVALGLLAAAVQMTWFTDSLFQGNVPNLNHVDLARLGPLKMGMQATFSKPSADLSLLMHFTSGLLVIVALAFSGVKWNPGNGKMAGLGCLITAVDTSYFLYQADGGMFVPRWIHVYCAFLLLGGLHIFLFPSNEVVKKLDPSAVNNHGNTSDQVFFILFACSMLMYFYPEHLTTPYGPVVATFRTAPSADINLCRHFTAGLLLTIACMFSGVKWNPVNGKMAGLGCFISAVSISYYVFHAPLPNAPDLNHVDLERIGKPFVLHPFYLYAAVLAYGGAHIMFFPSNPVLPKSKKN